MNKKTWLTALAITLAPMAASAIELDSLKSQIKDLCTGWSAQGARNGCSAGLAAMQAFAACPQRAQAAANATALDAVFSRVQGYYNGLKASNFSDCRSQLSSQYDNQLLKMGCTSGKDAERIRCAKNYVYGRCSGWVQTADQKVCGVNVPGAAAVRNCARIAKNSGANLADVLAAGAKALGAWNELEGSGFKGCRPSAVVKDGPITVR